LNLPLKYNGDVPETITLNQLFEILLQSDLRVASNSGWVVLNSQMSNPAVDTIAYKITNNDLRNRLIGNIGRWLV
jgi:hypothetical protein